MILLQPFDQLGHFWLEFLQRFQQRDLDTPVPSHMLSARCPGDGRRAYTEAPTDPQLQTPIFRRPAKDLAHLAGRGRVRMGKRLNHIPMVYKPAVYCCQEENVGSKEWAGRAKKLRSSLHLSQGEFARTLGVTPVAVSQWERGRKEPSTDRYIQMAKMSPGFDCWYFFEKAGLNRSDIYRLMPEIQATVLDRVEKQRIPEIKVLPAPKLKGGGPHKPGKARYFALPVLKDAAAAGAPRLVDEREVESYVIVPASQARPGPDWMTCIRVHGDSMEPILKEGYIVAVDSSVTDPRKLQKKMIVAYVDGAVTIKHLDRVGKQWVLTPENKACRQQPLGRNDRIIGRVAWWYGQQE